MLARRLILLLGAVSLPLLAPSASAAEAGKGESAAVIEHYGLQQGATPVKERANWRKPKKILLVGIAALAAPALREAVPDVEFVVMAPGTSLMGELEGQVANQLGDVDAVIGYCGPEIFAAGKSIRWVQVTSAGVEHCVSIPAMRERNILLTNMQRIGGPIIAEHVIAMVLTFTRGLDLYVTARPKGEWKSVTPPGRMTVVAGKTMLVVGLGGIGSEVAKRAHSLGMRVIATRASGRTGPQFVSYIGLPDELPKLASEADFIVNTAPLTAQTTGIFDAAFFARMKPTAYFFNVARGGSVVTSALVDALANKKIAGAGLDVTDPEPLPPDHALWKLPNVIITPHVSNDSDLGYDAQVQVLKENLRRYVAGERMLSEVDVARGY